MKQLYLVTILLHDILAAGKLIRFILASGNMMRRYIVMLLLLFPMVGNADRDSPETLLGRYMDHIAHGQWDEINSLMYPQDVENLKQLMLRIIRFENQYGDSRIQHTIFGEPVSNEVAAQRDASFFLTKTLQQMALALKREGFELKTHKVLGDVKEGRERIHLVTRLTLVQRGQTMANLQIYSFRKKDGRWYMEL